MAMGGVITKALIENSKITLSLDEAEKLTNLDTPTALYAKKEWASVFCSVFLRKNTKTALRDTPSKFPESGRKVLCSLV